MFHHRSVTFSLNIRIFTIPYRQLKITDRNDGIKEGKWMQFVLPLSSLSNWTNQVIFVKRKKSKRKSENSTEKQSQWLTRKAIALLNKNINVNVEFHEWMNGWMDEWMSRGRAHTNDLYWIWFHHYAEKVLGFFCFILHGPCLPMIEWRWRSKIHLDKVHAHLEFRAFPGYVCMRIAHMCAVDVRLILDNAV